MVMSHFKQYVRLAYFDSFCKLLIQDWTQTKPELPWINIPY